MLTKSDSIILSHVKEHGIEKGLSIAAKELCWTLRKIHSKYNELCPTGNIPIALDLNAICGDRWKFADTCRQYQDQGFCLQSIAQLMKCSVKTVQDWINTSKTFPPEYRYKELAPTVYNILADMPDPIETIKFARDEEYTVAKATQLKRKYINFRKRGKPSGRPFTLLNEDALVDMYNKGFSDGEIAEKLGVNRTTVLRRREVLGLSSVRKIGERGLGKTSKTSETSKMGKKHSPEPGPDLLLALIELTDQVHKLEAENRTLRKQCMTYLKQLQSSNKKNRFRIA